MDLEALFVRLEKHDPAIRERVLNVYLWGSRVYGCASPDSDYDLVALTKYNTEHDLRLFDTTITFSSHSSSSSSASASASAFAATPASASASHKLKSNISDIDTHMFPVFDDGLVNVSLIPYHDFMLSLYEHRHQALEVACLPREHVWLEQAPIEFRLDPDILRRTALWEAKRGFRNAGNKLRVLGATPYNYKRAKKEVVHALRYLLFAIQLVQTGTIHDYAAANDYQQSILSESSTSPPLSCSSSASSSVDETNEEEETKKDNVTLRFNQAILAKYKPIFQSLREKLKSLRTYSHFYSKRETERQGMKTMMELYWQQQRQQQQMVEPETWKIETDEKEASLDVVTHLRDETEKCGGNWKEALQRLAASRNVCYCFHSEYPHLVFLRHDPFTPSTSSNDTTNIERETCKGLILDITCNWEVVARFSSDLEESYAQTEKEAQTEEEENEMKVTEYVEGTPALLYHYNQQWHISSMYEPAKPQMDISWKGDLRNITFESLFWNTWNRDGYSLPNDTSRCYTFVLQTPLHRYVTRPEQDRLIFVGAITIPSLRECHDLITAIAEEHNWLTPRVFPELVSLNQVVAKAKTLNPFLSKVRTTREILAYFNSSCKKGFVVRFHSSERLVKVRCPLHVAVALGTDFSGVGPLNLRADMDERHMLDLLRYNCSETFIRYFPTWQPFHEQLSDKYGRMCSSLDHAWNQLKEHGDDKKQFAKAANRHPFAFLLFRLYRLWKEDLREYLSARQVFALCDDHMFSRAWSAFE